MKQNDVHRLEFFSNLNKKTKDINRFIHTFKRYELAVKFLKDKNNPTILDVRCGNNDFFKNFNIQGDINLIDKCKTRLKKNFTKIDFLKYKTKKKFNLITIYDSLGYQSYDNDFEIIKRAMSLLKKNGVCCISIVNYRKFYHPKYYKAPYDFSKLKILKTKLRKNYIIKTLYQNYPLNFISNISLYNKKKDFFIFVIRNK